MGAGDYENLGFQVGVDGADSAVSHLDKIIKRLEQIAKLQGSVSKTGKSGGLSKGFESYSKSGSLSKEDIEWYTQEGKLRVYSSAKKNIAATTELNHAYYEQERRIALLNAQRRKEIDARLKEELGIKKNTNELQKYISKLATVAVVARKLAQFVASAVKESSNYIENLNLFATAYGENYQESLKWALNLADGFGLASNEVLKFAGTFRQLSTSLGLVDDVADSVSKTVTELGYDFSALFNTSVETAMEKLQSGIFAGNVRPLRAYGIDISQNQIDYLFETNEALAQLGVNARNLTQSDKVLARLIITMKSGSNAFGTMYREINNLQSQFRIFQGSLSNLKLALGDLVEEPLKNIMIFVNAIIIALTNVIRTIKPLTTEDENPFSGIQMGAEEASEAIDEINGKLADFDKFNVLGGQSNGSNQVAVTEQLNALLQEQVAIYEKQTTEAMTSVENKAKELAGSLEGVVILFGSIGAVWGTSKIISLVKGVTKLSESFNLLNAGLSLTNVLFVSGLIFAITKAIDYFKEGNYLAGVLATTVGVILVVAWAALNREMLKTTATKIIDFFKKLISTVSKTSASITVMQQAFLGMSFAFALVGLEKLLNSTMSKGEKLTHIFLGLAAAIGAAAIAISLFSSNWVQALTIAATVASGYYTIASMSAHANGGYTNANLIMTHENGKREWVGKAAGSSAIVNDSQMSDIMEIAVAKGVYKAMSADRATNTPQTKTPLVIKIGSEEVFNVFFDEARRRGYTLSKN